MRAADTTVTLFRRRGLLVRAGAALIALGLAGCATPPADRPATTTTQTTPTAPTVNPAAPVTVALLVPLGSADAQQTALARSLVNAARLAQSDLAGAAIDLKVYETAGDANRAREAAARAIADGAKVIVGPLFGIAAQAVGPVAAEAGINVLTFSTTPAVAGRNVFLLGQTAETEADRLLAFARSRGIGTAGVFYPRTPSGQAAMDAIRAAATRHGLTLTSAMDYPRSFQGIQERSRDYAADHSAEAVILPEGGQALVSAGAFLNYYNVSPTRTKYLGLGQWNGPATTKEGALLGGWFVAPDPALFAAFASRYRAAYGDEPAPIAGLAYDGIAAIGALIRDARTAGDSDPFSVENLTNPEGFAGVNGIFRLRRDGRIDRALAVMEVGADGFTVIDPAPRRFDRPAS
jgi:hypothetical protein